MTGKLGEEVTYDMCEIYCDSSIDLTGENSLSIRVDFDQSKWEGFQEKWLNEKKWVSAKYLNANKKPSKRFSGITSEHGGIFIWVVKPHRIPVPGYSFIAYIGKSEKNLQASINSFILDSVSRYQGESTKKQLFDKCALDLYVNYYECDDEKKSKDITDKLIKIISPPIREIPINLQQGEEAFAS